MFVDTVIRPWLRADYGREIKHRGTADLWREGKGGRQKIQGEKEGEKIKPPFLTVPCEMGVALMDARAPRARERKTARISFATETVTKKERKTVGGKENLSRVGSE